MCCGSLTAIVIAETRFFTDTGCIIFWPFPGIMINGEILIMPAKRLVNLSSLPNITEGLKIVYSRPEFLIIASASHFVLWYLLLAFALVPRALIWTNRFTPFILQASTMFLVPSVWMALKVVFLVSAIPNCAVNLAPMREREPETIPLPQDC